MNQTEQITSTTSSETLPGESGRIVVNHHMVPAQVRQQAIVALGRRAVAPPDLSLLMCDAAALAAETLQLKYFSAAELNPGGKSLAFALGRTDCPDEQRIPPKKTFPVIQRNLSPDMSWKKPIRWLLLICLNSPPVKIVI